MDTKSILDILRVLTGISFLLDLPIIFMLNVYNLLVGCQFLKNSQSNKKNLDTQKKAENHQGKDSVDVKIEKDTQQKVDPVLNISNLQKQDAKNKSSMPSESFKKDARIEQQYKKS